MASFFASQAAKIVNKFLARFGYLAAIKNWLGWVPGPKLFLLKSRLEIYLIIIYSFRRKAAAATARLV